MPLFGCTYVYTYVYMQAHTDRWSTQKHNGSGPIYRMGRGIKITKKEKKQEVICTEAAVQKL